MKLNKHITIYFNSNIGVISFLLYTLFVVPATVFYYNSDMFRFSLIDYYRSMLWIVIILLGIFFILNKLLPRIMSVYNQIGIVVALYISIINFVFPIDIGLLDGINDAFNPAFNKEMLLQLFKLTILLVFILLLKKYFANVVKYFIYVNVIIGFLWISFSLMANVHARHSSIKTVESERLLNQNYALSPDKNILVISFDGMQGNYVREVIDNNLPYKNLFDGFTFFSDVTPTATRTFLSLADILSGKLSGTQHESFADVFNNLATDNMVIDAQLSGYNAILYSIDDYFCSVIDNCFHQRSREILDLLDSYNHKNYQYLLQISTMRYIPGILHGIYNVFTQKLSHTNSQLLNRVFKASQNGLDDPDYIDHLLFNDFVNNLSINSNAPTLKIHHYLVTHEPMKFSEDCVYKGIIVQDEMSIKSQIRCGLNTFVKLIQKLKQLEIYDQTAIFFFSDHGYQVRGSIPVFQQHNEEDFYAGVKYPEDDHTISRFNATLFYKPFETSGSLVTNDSPVSLLDIRSTLCHNFKDCNVLNLEGISLDSDISENRQRNVLVYVGGTKYFIQRRASTKYYKRLTFQGAFSKLSELYSSDLLPINLGDTLEFSDINHNAYQAVGLSGTEDAGVWTDGNIAIVSLVLNDTLKQNDITLKLQAIPYVNEKHPHLSAKFFINNKLMDTKEFNHFSDDTKGQQEILLNIPKELISNRQEIELKIEMTDPMSPYQLELSSDTRMLGLLLRTIALSPA